MEYQLGDQVLDLRGGKWGRHQEEGASVDVTHVEDAAGTILHIACSASGSASNHVQLWGPQLPVEKGACLLLTFRARSSKPFRFPGIAILPRRFPLDAVCEIGPDEPPCGRGLGDVSSGV